MNLADLRAFWAKQIGQFLIRPYSKLKQQVHAPIRAHWTRLHAQYWVECRTNKVWGKCPDCREHSQKVERLSELQQKERKDGELDEKDEKEMKRLINKIRKNEHHFKAKENMKVFDDDLELVRQDTRYVLMIVDFSRMSVGGGKTKDINDSIAVLLMGDGCGGIKRKYIDTLPHHEEVEGNNDFFFYRQWQYDILHRVVKPMGKTKVIQWSDGGRKHYKQRHSLAEASLAMTKHPWLTYFSWNFWPSNHGKGLADSHAGKIAQMVAYMAFHEDWIWETARDLGWLIKTKLSDSEPMYFADIINRESKYKHPVVGIKDLYLYHHFEFTTTPGKLFMKTLRHEQAIEFRFKTETDARTVHNTLAVREQFWWPPELGLPPVPPQRIRPRSPVQRGRYRQQRRRLR